jgi:hypothetical protein
VTKYEKVTGCVQRVGGELGNSKLTPPSASGDGTSITVAT